MSLEAVTQFLTEQGFADRIHVFDTSSATVALAAEALHCEPQRIAKTLSFLAGDHAVLIVAAGDARIDNPKFKAQFGRKATMLSPQQAVELVGHAVGGVCPFCVKESARVFLDASLKRFSAVYPACGSANSAVELSPAELERLCPGALWVDVCKDWV